MAVRPLRAVKNSAECMIGHVNKRSRLLIFLGGLDDYYYFFLLILLEEARSRNYGLFNR